MKSVASDDDEMMCESQRSGKEAFGCGKSSSSSSSSSFLYFTFFSIHTRESAKEIRPNDDFQKFWAYAMTTLVLIIEENNPMGETMILNCSQVRCDFAN